MSESERKTKRHSGAFYRKEREKKEDEKRKLHGSLERFIKKVECSTDLIKSEDCHRSSAEIEATKESEDNLSPGNEIVSSDETLASGDVDMAESDFAEAHPGTSTENTTIGFNVSDAGTWPSNLTSKIIELLIETELVSVRENFKFPTSETGRQFSYSYFYKVLKNGEKVKRTWLLYSVSLDAVFCFPCKLFRGSGGQNIQLINLGYRDWRHCSDYFSRHENSAKHMNCVKTYWELKTRLSKNNTIDIEQQTLFSFEKKRWRAIIERMIAIVQFLASQNLAFRGSSSNLYEKNNGNFLKAVEMIAKFDPVLSEHINNVQKSKDRNNRIPHYLGQHFQNEIIALLADATKKQIMNIVQNSKYYSIILDCTPDISHTEQITFIIRCVNILDGKSVISEYFVGFYPIEDTTGEGLFNFLLDDLLSSLHLDVQNIRGQGYDNGANMRGKNIGLQKRVLDINPRAFFVPCAAHSLNLVVNDAAKSCGEIVNFFDIIQELYNFFSSSTYRWDILKKTVTKFSLKPLSDTRWESRINALRPLKTNLKNILVALGQLSQESKDRAARLKAKSLAEKICSFKFICSVIIWHDLLERINIVSKMLQQSNKDLAECVEALKNLKTYLISKRNDENFTEFLNQSSILAHEIEVEPEFPEIRERKKPRMFHYESKDEYIAEPKQQFKVCFYFQILDIAINSVGERFDLLESCFSLFSFLLTFHSEDTDNLRKSCFDLDIKLQINKEGKTERDLDGIELHSELLSFRDLFPNVCRLKPIEILNHILSQDLTPYFPNLSIALRIFLTIPISVASGERSFSKLSLIKNYLRSTISQDRLTNLAIISIESDICEALDVSGIIDEFACKKARKICL